MRGHRATALLHRSATAGTQSRAAPPQRSYQHSFVGRTIEHPPTPAHAGPYSTAARRKPKFNTRWHLNLSLQNIVGSNQGFELEYFVMVCIGLVMANRK